jgi:hypothetical protein
MDAGRTWRSKPSVIGLDWLLRRQHSLEPHHRDMSVLQQLGNAPRDLAERPILSECAAIQDQVTRNGNRGHVDDAD